MDYPIRHGGFTLGPIQFTVRGRMLQAGDPAPDFRLIANNFSVKTLQDYQGKVKLFSIVPSLDTAVCDAQTRRFNQAASQLGEQVMVLTVSADLPFAQARWCGAAGVERVETLSTHKDMQFSDDYGVHVLEPRYNQRAIIVVDANDMVAYAEYVPDVDMEVNFEAALAATQAATKTMTRQV